MTWALAWALVGAVGLAGCGGGDGGGGASGGSSGTTSGSTSGSSGSTGSTGGASGTSGDSTLSLAAAAGEALFNDKSLSVSGKQSCATCHVAARAFTGDPATDQGLPPVQATTCVPSISPGRRRVPL